MKIAYYQMASVTGDFLGNAKKILQAAQQAASQGVQLLVTPKLSLGGATSYDRWLDDEYCEQQALALAYLAENMPDSFYCIVGGISREIVQQYKHYNQAFLVTKDEVTLCQNQAQLVSQDVASDHRYFASGSLLPAVTLWPDIAVGVIIADDIWHLHSSLAVKNMLDAKCQLLVVIDASPFDQSIVPRRLTQLQEIAYYGVPVLYVNSVGGHTDLVFDGQSFMVWPNGSFAKGAAFAEELGYMQPFMQPLNLPNNSTTLPDLTEQLYQALVCGLRDYVRGSGFSQVHLGLSGGIDSALVACLAVDALGHDAVQGFLLPSRYSSDHSINDALQLAQNLQIKTYTCPIKQTHDVMLSELGQHFDINGLADENTQARIRGNFLMAFANATGSLLLTTGNKSELSTGYGTLYGDMCGGFNPIGDIWKTQVYELCHYINKKAQCIPQNILTKEPSAELRPNQTDQQTLPPYAVVDAILSAYIEQKIGKDQLIQQYDTEIVEHLLSLLSKNEFKRQQGAPVLRVSRKSFGRGRIWPLV